MGTGFRLKGGKGPSLIFQVLSHLIHAQQLKPDSLDELAAGNRHAILTHGAYDGEPQERSQSPEQSELTVDWQMSLEFRWRFDKQFEMKEWQAQKLKNWWANCYVAGNFCLQHGWTSVLSMLMRSS